MVEVLKKTFLEELRGQTESAKYFILHNDGSMSAKTTSGGCNLVMITVNRNSVSHYYIDRNAIVRVENL